MKFNNLLKNKYSSFSELEKVIEAQTTTKLRGDLFEEFVYAYLKINSALYQIKDVYREKDIPQNLREKLKLAKRDSGVDGLMVLNDGKLSAYQVKFRTNRAKPDYSELAKFWTEAKHADLMYVIANCYKITNLAKKQDKHLQILVDEFENLDQQFFGELYNLTNQKAVVKRELKKPYQFQEKILADVEQGFKEADRGKLIAACGTGKTLTALWITERLNTNNVLFLAPSLALIKQTLDEWAKEYSQEFIYQCVCSDNTVAIDTDDGDIYTSDFNVPVTTNPKDVKDFLESLKQTKKVVFCTYQSLEVLSEAFKLTKNFSFDLAIFDEAHRTSGTKESGLFQLALKDEVIKSKKKLFMTATQRLIKPFIKKRAEEKDLTVFSMDDEKIYGKVFHEFNFGKAIAEKVISDYQIIIACITEEDSYKSISSNIDLTDETTKKNTAGYTLFTQTVLSNALSQYPIRKAISFHSSIENAKIFVGSDASITLNEVITAKNKNITKNNIFISHINGSMPTGDRKEILDKFKNAQYGIISNSRCLTEGVDVPVIDCVYFVDTKNSLIDIVQACGRALRKPKNLQKDLAFFIVPILIKKGSDDGEALNSSNFETVFSILQALRGQDERMEEWINEININIVKGGKRKRYTGEGRGQVKITVPDGINLQDFADKVFLEIASANPPSTTYKEARKYGKTERKSNFKRIFTTFGDYSMSSYQTSAVDNTLAKFTGANETILSKDLKINNNNVSHTYRLGLIDKVDKASYQLTQLGQDYFNKKIDFKPLFQKQMLISYKYENEGGQDRLIFPYRTFIKILLETKTINFYEFVFAIYPIYDSSPQSISQAIKDIQYMRDEYPNMDFSNIANQQTILKELNDKFSLDFKHTDIWAKNTTINNQYIYFRNHLSQFEDFIQDINKVITLTDENMARKALAEENSIEYEKDENKLRIKYTKSKN